MNEPLPQTKEERRLKFLAEHPLFSYGELPPEPEGTHVWRELGREERRWRHAHRDIRV